MNLITAAKFIHLVPPFGGRGTSGRLRPLVEPEAIDYTISNNSEEGFSFNTLSQTIQEGLASLGIPDANYLVMHVERLGLLMTSLANTSNYIGAISSFLQYASAFADKSLLFKVEAFLNGMFVTPMAGGQEREQPSEETWSQYFGKLQVNWNSMKENPLFDHVSQLLSLAVLLEITTVEKVTFDIKNVRIWGPDLKLLQKDAFSIIDAAGQTLLFFCEKIASCIETRSAKPMLYSSLRAQKLDELFLELYGNAELMLSGGLWKVKKISDNEYQKKLDIAKRELEFLKMGEKNPGRARILQTRLEWCSLMQSKVSTIKKSSSMRMAPMLISVFGKPGVGKTTFLSQSLDICFEAAGMDSDHSLRYIKRSGVKHWDGFRSSCNAVILDDYASVKAQFSGGSGENDVILLQNNTAFSPPMAELADKKNVYGEPSLIGLTTNIDDYAASETLRNTGAFERRMEVQVELIVKKEFRKDRGNIYGLDTGKVKAWKTANDIEDPIDDVWILNLWQAEANANVRVTPKKIPIIWKGKEMLGIDVFTYGTFIAERFLKHQEEQRYIVEQSKIRCSRKCEVDGCTQFAKVCCKHTKQQQRKFWEERARQDAALDKHVLATQPKSDSQNTTQQKPLTSNSPILTEADFNELHNIKEEKKPAKSWFWQNFKKKHADKVVPKAYEDYLKGDLDVESDVDVDDDPEFESDHEYNKEDEEEPDDDPVRDDIYMQQAMQARAEKRYLDRVAREMEEEEEKNKLTKKFFWRKQTIHIGDEAAGAIIKSSSTIYDTLSRELFGIARNVDVKTAVGLLTARSYFLKHFNWMQLIPTPWVKSPYMRKFWMMVDYKRLRNRYIFNTFMLWGTIIPATLGVIALTPPIQKREAYRNWFGFTTTRLVKDYTKIVKTVGSCTLGLLGITLQKGMAQRIQDGFDKQLLKYNAIDPTYKELRDRVMPKVWSAGLILSTAMVAARIYHKLYMPEEKKNKSSVTGEELSKQPPGGDATQPEKKVLNPKNAEEEKERDKTPQPWSFANFFTFGSSVSEKVLTTKPTDCLRKVAKNTVHLKFGNQGFANGLFVRTGLLLIPNHYFDEVDELDVKIISANPNTQQSKMIKAAISKRLSYKPPCQGDYRFCYCPYGGDFEDLTHMFPDGPLDRDGLIGHWRNSDGKIIEMKGLGDPGPVNYEGMSMVGGQVNNMSTKPFDGSCGMMWIGQGKKSGIHGMQVAGNENRMVSVYVTITRKVVEDATTFLNGTSGCVISASATKMVARINGVKTLESTDIHPSAVVKILGQHSHIEVLGSVGTRSSSRSDVKNTVISAKVTEHLGIEDKWMAPKFKPEQDAWYKNLAKMNEPALFYPGDLLWKAVEDYKEPVVQLFTRRDRDYVRPLTEQENLCGIPGIKFIDAMNLSASAGFGFKGKKRDWIIEEVDPQDKSLVKRRLSPEVMEEVLRYEKAWMNEERVYPIAKACKKDEVLPKEKCRIFFNSPFAMIYLIRKYFLPIIRVMQLNPITTECAVGINPYGPEWDELMSFMKGKKNLFGGDYGSYDTKLTSQLLNAAFSILIDCAAGARYSPFDLRIMRNMVADIVHACIEFDGSLIMTTLGVHISGNSLTVILNGLCGSINLRCFFHSLYPDAFGKMVRFREKVNLITYGDDNGGSVDPSCPEFTIANASKFLGKYGHIYTMPDKDSELQDYLREDQFDFLKRISKKLPELPVATGALSMDSIHKGLHKHVRPRKSPMSDELATASNVDDALLELFYHGEEVYEKYREKLTIITRECGIDHMCCRLKETYSERVDMWKATYDLEPD